MYGDGLSERKKQILKAIIDAHIAYGEPVGSKYLAESKGLACSPATIRNEMAELEAMGYLEQPHTSAGRIPSELGYRFYVDSLVRRYSMTTKEIEEIDRTLKNKLAEVDQILAEASRLASSFTNYTGIAVKPKKSQDFIKRFEVVFIDERNFVLVMVFPDGSAKTKTIHTATPLTVENLTALTSALNDKLAGVSADGISLSTIMEIERSIPDSSQIVGSVVKVIYEAIATADRGDIKIDGVNNLLQYPEYSDVAQVKGLLDIFEHKEDIVDLVSADSTDDKVNVYIGRENALGVNNSSLVFRTIRRNGDVVGAIGVIGPCRMNYSKVITTIDRLAQGIDAMLNSDDDNMKG